MARQDTFDEVAAILHPLPDRYTYDPDGEPEEHNPDIYNDLCEEALREAEDAAANMRLSWEESDHASSDPVLSTLADLRDRQRGIERKIRQLLAYGREFVYPRPYQLTALAKAAEMSPSGVRTAYDNATIHEVADLTGRSLRRTDADDQGESPEGEPQ